MRAAWYETQGPALEVLKVGVMPARAINEALVAGWDGMPIAERLPLDAIATAHERLEAPRQRGRVIVLPG